MTDETHIRELVRELDEAKRALWSDRGVMLDLKRELDEAREVLREIAECSTLDGAKWAARAALAVPRHVGTPGEG